MFAKQSMINRLSNTINRNRSAAKISKVMSSIHYTRPYITIAQIHMPFFLQIVHVFSTKIIQ